MRPSRTDSGTGLQPRPRPRRTTGGASGSVKFYVDNLKQIVEQEPNDLPAKAAAVSLPASVWGTDAIVPVAGSSMTPCTGA